MSTGHVDMWMKRSTSFGRCAPRANAPYGACVSVLSRAHTICMARSIIDQSFENPFRSFRCGTECMGTHINSSFSWQAPTSNGVPH